MNIYSDLQLVMPKVSAMSMNVAYRAWGFLAPAGVAKLSTVKLVVDNKTGTPLVSNLLASIWSINATTGLPDTQISTTPIAASSSSNTPAVGMVLTYNMAGDNHALTPGTRYAFVLANTETNVATTSISLRCPARFVSTGNSGYNAGTWNATKAFTGATRTWSGTAVPAWSTSYTLPANNVFHEWTFDSGVAWGVDLHTGTSLMQPVVDSTGRTTNGGEVSVCMPGKDCFYNVNLISFYVYSVAGSGAATLRVETSGVSRSYDIGDLTSIPQYSYINVPTPGLKIPAGAMVRLTLPSSDNTNYTQFKCSTHGTGGNTPEWIKRSYIKTNAVGVTASTVPMAAFMLDADEPLSPQPLNRRQFNAQR